MPRCGEKCKEQGWSRILHPPMLSLSRYEGLGLFVTLLPTNTFTASLARKYRENRGFAFQVDGQNTNGKREATCRLSLSLLANPASSSAKISKDSMSRTHRKYYTWLTVIHPTLMIVVSTTAVAVRCEVRGALLADDQTESTPGRPPKGGRGNPTFLRIFDRPLQSFCAMKRMCAITEPRREVVDANRESGVRDIDGRRCG